MAFTDAEDLLRRQVETEFTRRNSTLHENIEKELSRLSAIGLGSSSVAITSFRNLVNSDLSERIDFIYAKLKVNIGAKKVKYDKTLQQRAIILISELGEMAKSACLRISREFIERINPGSVIESEQITNQIYMSKLEEVLNNLELYIDELKNNTKSSVKTWINNNATAILVGTVTGIIVAIATLIMEKYFLGK